MTVRVLFFASLRETLGDALELELPQEATLAGLRAHLTATLTAADAAALNAAEVRVALNQNLVHDEDVAIRDGDEVAYMPPVTGG